MSHVSKEQEIENSLQMAKDAEGGRRELTGKIGFLVQWFAIVMSVFQLYTGFFGELSGYKQLSVHLFFALGLCFTCFPFSKKSSTGSLTAFDFCLALIGGLSAIYMFANYEHWANAQGDAAIYDIIIGGILLAVILEATRRSVSPLLPVITLLFLFYAYLGPYIPGELGHRGFRVSRIIDHVFMSGEGLWSIPLRVSSTFIFLFVLFGALVDKTGAGEYLIRLSFATMGRFRGGPAKAAVVASAAMGSISGSSIANTVTTGAMTIPLMKKVGFKPHSAGAVEVAASTNGQLMPPIMGAAAFIMAEMIGVSYFEVIKAAFIPAVLSYTAIFSIVHIEAIKHGIERLSKEETPLLINTLLSGTHFLIPFIVLVILLLVFFLTPATSVSWAILAGAAVAMGNNIIRKRKYERALKEKTDHHDPVWADFTEKPKGFIIRQTVRELLETLETGARNMAGVSAACACCGIIIGVVTLTGLGLKMATFIPFLAGGSLFYTLLYSVLACIILGMGLPTTATYIVMAAMTAPAIQSLSADLNLGIPIIAIHLFVFYYGIVADDTPPVGLCAYAAAGIAGSDPIRTGWKSFRLDLAAFTLPFMFIYNPKLLMYDTNIQELLYIIPVSVIGMYCWSVFIQGFFLVKTYLWERFVFLILTFVFVSPSGISFGMIQIGQHMANLICLAVLGTLFIWQRNRKNNNGVIPYTAPA
ncbi:MAG: TRAP transporter permease [Desulfobacteraceae bacterium]|nr:TRAP transporter permease [Desulfobacteraceae bacterium]